MGLIIPLVPGHVRKMGANHIYVGLLGSIYAGFQLGSGPLIVSVKIITMKLNLKIFLMLLVDVRSFT